MRHVFQRLRDNILKRYVMLVAAFNLSLVMRAILGVGTQRELRGPLQLALDALAAALERLIDDSRRLLAAIGRGLVRLQRSIPASQDRAFSTGC